MFKIGSLSVKLKLKFLISVSICFFVIYTASHFYLHHQEKQNGLNYIYAILLLFGVMILIYVFYIFKRLFGEIEMLEKGAIAISKGDLSFRMPVKSNNEFALLANEFNFMAEKVEESLGKESEINRLKNEFFMLAAHEMRTPLVAIRGNLELIRDFFGGEIKNEDVKHILEDAHSGSVRLIEIVNNFLDVSRLEQGKLLLKKERIYIITLIDDLMHEFEMLAGGKNVSLHLNIPDDLPQVFVDPARAKQILYNLVINAINHTENGSVKLEAMKRGGMVEVLVIDTGVGIPAESQSSLFQKFQQTGDVLRRDNIKSVGLGLYLSKLIVDALGGEIKLVKSEVGKGSIFSFTLPIADNNSSF